MDRIEQNINSSLFEGDFCGHRKWWFRNPEPIPTPYAKSCDKCCHKSERVKVDFYHHDSADNNTSRKGKSHLCRIDLRNDAKLDANSR